MTDPQAPSPNRLLLGSLHQVTVGHTSQGFWRHPDCRSGEYNQLSYWIDLARKLEAAGFDFLFLADALGALDVYGDSPDVALRGAVEIPLADPLMILSALAAATTSLGLAVTASTSYEYPYLLARKFATLDHFTGGRVGFNVVTSALNSAAVNLGRTEQTPHDERYDIAEEFLDVVYKLWEASWEDGSVRRDRQSGVFTDPAKVHPIEHRGRYFEVPGIALTEPSPQRTPVIFQAGASERGRDFAARHAEAIFLANDRAEQTRRFVDDVRGRARAAGRPPGEVKFLSMLTVVTAPSTEQAQRKAADYRQYFDYEAELAQLSALFGIDLSAVDPDEPLEYVETDSIRGMLALYTAVDADRNWTTRQIAELSDLAGAGPLFVGDPVSVVDQMVDWAQATGVDGFNIADPVPPATVDDFATYVAPELRRRGLIQPAPQSPLTLRERLYGAGHTRTSPSHPSASFRRV